MFQDLAEKQFERLKVIRRIGTRGKNSYWECLCSCGNTTEVRSCDLRAGVIKSCGCYGAEIIQALREQAVIRKAAREAERAQLQAERVRREQERQRKADEWRQRRSEQAERRKAKRDRLSEWIRAVYSAYLPVNHQIAAVIRRLRGHAKRREVAKFFKIKPELVTGIWTGDRWRPATDGDGQPIPTFEFPYFVSVYDLNQ